MTAIERFKAKQEYQEYYERVSGKTLLEALWNEEMDKFWNELIQDWK